MGFDLTGLNPNNPNNAVQPSIDWSSNPTQEETNKYFEKMDKYHTEVPGNYFRNNVWYWRPLWDFVCSTCYDILTEKDMEGGSFNDGHEISKTKAIRIANRLKKMDKLGTLDKSEDTYKKQKIHCDKHNKKIEKKMNNLKKEVVELTKDKNIAPKDYPRLYKKEWDRLYNQKKWTSSYPFDAENVRAFIIFCENSGGFVIC